MKLHPSLASIVERLKSKTQATQTIQPTADEAKFFRDGKVEVQVWLADKTPEAIAALKAMGFEVVLEPQSAKMVIGRLPIEKLEEAARLKFVRYIAPQM